MSESGLDRIRRDLETIREASGISLPFGWEDVWLNLVLVPFGVIIALAGTFAPFRLMRLGVLLLVVVAVVATIGLRVRFRRSTGRSPTRRREYTLALVAGCLFGLLAAYHLIWGKAHGLSPTALGSVAVSFSGGMLVVLALAGPGRLSYLGGALPLILYGLVLPYCSPRQVVMAGSAALALAGLLTGLIQAVQLRSEGGGHEPAAD